MRCAGSSRVRRVANANGAILAIAAAAILAAAPARAEEAKPGAQIPDPWEHVNRGLYKFGIGVDKAIIAPAVRAYIAVTPDPVRAGIKHAVNNLDEPETAANDLLQGHLDRASRSAARFVINSTLGVAGFIDVAGRTGLPGHDSDFGQTLGRYGIGTGPYVFVPFVGPSDVRDGVGRIIDLVGDPVAWTLGGLRTTFGQVHDGVYVAQERVDIQNQMEGLDRDFTDPYVSMKSGYSQHRAFKVQDDLEQTASAVNNLPDFGADAAPGPAAPAKP